MTRKQELHEVTKEYNSGVQAHRPVSVPRGRDLVLAEDNYLLELDGHKHLKDKR